MTAKKATRQSVKVVKGALDIIEMPDGREAMVLRGIIDPDSLRMLQVDSYQREALPRSKVSDIELALSVGEVPDIDLGMRGEDCRNHDDGTFYLFSPVYIVDGLQRVTAAINLLDRENGTVPRLGATIHFNTTPGWEKQRFQVLNSERVRVSANILLRNLKDENEGMKLLYGLTKAKDFVLKGKVCWSQRMAREHMITAVTYLKAVARLHCHIGPGRSTKATQLAQGWETIYERTGRNIMRANVKAFFDIIDECWGITSVTYRDSNPQLYLTFLTALADFFSAHPVFWREKRLMVTAPYRRKLAGFNIRDPHIRELASASGSARDLLYQLIVNHVNAGKRTRRLVPREEPDFSTDLENGNGDDNGDTEE